MMQSPAGLPAHGSWVRRLVVKLEKLKEKKGPGRFWLILLFIMLPQLAATIITGYSLSMVWHKSRGKEKIEISSRRVLEIVLIWILAYVWLLVFWGGIVLWVKSFVFI